MAPRASNRVAAASVAVLTTAAFSLRADDRFAPGAGDVASVFFVAKSENKNQVHYGVRLDEACRLVGERPIFAYWRMLQQHGELEPLLDIETAVYGLVDRQEVTSSAPGETTITVALRALPDRPVTIVVRRGAVGCEATATTSIAGAAARFRFVYVHLRWPFGIDYLMVRGARLPAGPPVQEIVRP